MSHINNTTVPTWQEEPIAVIGIACRFPGGANTPSKLKDLIRAPYDLSKTVPANRFDTTSFFHADNAHHGTTNANKAYFLEEDVQQFDPAFFNVQASEADAMDPQQRLLMEVVYESLCNSGQRVEDMRGSNTAVYVGLMCDDWSQLTGRDWELTPTYAATGTSRAIFSNRLSYFFDWNGPSMTIDTACSSSLVAVHQAVGTLRSGESDLAVVAGTNLILSPGMWIAESNLRMLSPTGTSKMWDASADGYARGEGLAAIILKPLGAALRAGDPINCVIRATGVNQDGRTAGITVPSNVAQTQLITDTYARAGMNVRRSRDRPQFFHAHGTGTPAGDPQEAEAIAKAFFGTETGETEDGQDLDPMYVGSIKTVIGHTEGTAGLASLVSTALAMKHGFIPPNLHFNNPSRSVAPFLSNLRVPTETIPWPETEPGQPRRASINSFGFGGTNAHAIIEYHSSHQPPSTSLSPVDREKILMFTPLLLSAASPSALRQSLSNIQSYLMDDPSIPLRRLLHTLHTCRSTLAYRTSIVCDSTHDAVAAIGTLLTGAGDDELNLRYPDIASPRILGVFTGQGAQWARMGAALIELSPYVRKRLSELDSALSSLPEADRPDWTLQEQLTAAKDQSRLAEAAISQPLCTAVQIILVDLVRAAGLHLSAVVGHSSGEIGAAYAAGFLSSRDTLRVAYYRGLYAKNACSPTGAKGAMMAVGTTYEDAVDFCSLEEFEDRIQVAAQNSPASVTLSGDKDVIDEALAVLQDEGKFARRLQVDTAYHSRHMLACVAQYRNALASCEISIQPGTDTIWLSSVLPGRSMTRTILQERGPEYWVDNMTNPVLFCPAVSAATELYGPFNLAIELGPHPALKSPCIDSMKAKNGQEPPYTGMLSRGKNDVSELARSLGFVWTRLGPKSVTFDHFERTILGSPSSVQPLTDLPAYPFDHTRSYGQLSRYSGAHLVPSHAPNPLLGRRLIECETTDQITWRNILSSSEISWLSGHALQGQTVFPAMGYVAMAVEAILQIAGSDRPLGLIQLKDVIIGRALAFESDRSKMETRTVVTINRLNSEEFHGHLICYSGLPQNSNNPLARNFSTDINCSFHEPRADALPAVRIKETNLLDTDIDSLYDQFASLGYNYSKPFTGVSSIKRKNGYATGSIEDICGSGWEDQLLIHPGWLDSALQTAFAAYCYPHDNRFWSLHVPTAIHSITVNPYFTSRGAREPSNRFEYQSFAEQLPGTPVRADIEVFAGSNFEEVFVQIESVEIRPFAQATAADDATLFTAFDYRQASPDGIAVTAGEDFFNEARLRELEVLERVGYFYIRQMYESLTMAEKENALPHYKHFLGYAERTVATVEKGLNPYIPKEASHDTRGYIQSLIVQYSGSVDMRLLEAAGDNIVTSIRQSTSILEHLFADNLLDEFYQSSVALTYANALIGRIIAQIAHRHPGLCMFEVGAGTGGATSHILPAVEDALSMYTYTDISAGFFNRVQNQFQKYAHRMRFATYDVDKSPTEQGFEDHSYDVIIASNVLHATGSIDNTIANVRRLLKPGGYLVALEIITNKCLAIHACFGALPGWWAGSENESWRRDGPALTIEQWDNLTRRHGFSGVDTHTPIRNALQAFSVIVCQAVDPFISAIREPLSVELPLSLPALVIVGGSKPEVSDMVRCVTGIVGSRFSSIVHLFSLEDLTKSNQPEGYTVLSLTELDEQFLEYRTSSKFSALKCLWRNARNVLWVTRNARAGNPHSAIMVGMCRSARFEYPHLNLRLLDFDTMPSAQHITEGLFRLELDAEMRARGDDGVLWTFESEIYIENGQALIPRLYPNVPGNQRYNTSRRVVRNKVNLSETLVEPAANANGNTFDVQVVSPLKSRAPDSRSNIRVKTNYSILQAIKVAGGFFHLCAATNILTGENIVALTQGSMSSIMEISVSHAQVMSYAPDCSVMSNLVLNLVAQSIMSISDIEEGVLLIHNANTLLCKAISKVGAARGICIVFTTDQKETAKSGIEIYLHPSLPRRSLKNLIPRDVAIFVDFSTTDNPLSSLLQRIIPRHATSYNTSDFISAHAGSAPLVCEDQIPQMLQVACRSAKRHSTHSTGQGHVSIVSLEAFGSSVKADSILSILDWQSSNSVEAIVQPIDAGIIFRDNGTYWLLGLTGDVGISICHWMVRHGARHVVLSSRNPSVDPRSFDSLGEFQADIRIISVDVSSHKSLHEGYIKIQKDMPQIIGVANGAMVLEDKLFDEVEYESIERAMLPKVEGSILLDHLFYSTPLDFFILFTSVAGVVGTSGQSTYVMANCFMTSLARHRRNIRGVAGSDIAIGSVQGLGYIMRNKSISIDHFAKRGYRNLSEQDLHQLFAEAILAGRPGHNGDSQVISGIQPFREAHAQLTTNSHFQHMRLRDDELNEDGACDGKSGNVSTRTRLASVKSQAEAADVVQDSFLIRLRSILMMPKTEVIDPHKPLVELGADSIMAVDIRAWFLKELDVDIPVLKILGPGETVADLVEESISKLSMEVDTSQAANRERKTNAITTTDPGFQPISELVSNSSASESGKTGSSHRSSTSSPDLTTALTPIKPSKDLEGRKCENLGKINEKSSSCASIVMSSSERKELMTLGQKRFWFLSQYVQDHTTFNITYFCKLQGRIRKSDLMRAVEAVSQRHESLRTRFFCPDDDSKTPMQGILSKPLIKVEFFTVDSVSQAQQAFEEMQNYRWNLDNWLPLRMQLLSLSPTEHFWIIGTHHISMDGLSFSVLMLDIQKAYMTSGQRLPPLAPESQIHALGAQQRRAINGGKLLPAIEYYRKALKSMDFAKPIDLFPFARIHVRSPILDYETHVAEVHLDATKTAKLKRIAREQCSTGFHAYLAALQTLVFRLLDEETTEQVVIGLSDANRLEKASMESVGNLLNLLPIRFDRSRDQSFGNAIQDTRDRVNNALKYSALPFDVLLDELNVPRSTAWSPVFQIYMDYRLVVKEHATKDWLGCKIQEETWRTARHGYDVLVEVTDSPNGATIGIHVQKALYSEKSAQLLARSYLNVLKQVADVGSKLNTGRMEKWDRDDLQASLSVGKGPAMTLQWPPTVGGKVDEIIASNGNDIALREDNGATLTYRAMDERIGSIAASIEKVLPKLEGAQPVIGVLLSPSSDFICALLAIWRLGAIYVPLDLTSGAPRIRMIVSATQPVLILTEQRTCERVAEVDESGEISTLNVSKSQTVSSHDRKVKMVHAADSTAYILFTSGSTGEPKGIVVQHAGVRAYLEGLHRTWNIAEQANVVLQQTALSFDPSIIQAFAALCTGGCLVIASADTRGDPKEMVNLMINYGVTYTIATPSEYEMWFRFCGQKMRQCTKWKAAWYCGEPAPPSLLVDFRGIIKHIPGIRLFNCYGATESSIAGIEGEVDLQDDTLQVPVPGRPLPSYGCYIVDRDLNPQPIGVPGEIIIAGLGVAGNYYLNRPDLTSKSFLKDHLTQDCRKGWTRMYRTGDRGRMDNQGNITVHGRIDGDTQIKLRGFRIELTEIEKVIMQESSEALRSTLVTLDQDNERGQYLVARIVFKGDSDISDARSHEITSNIMGKLRLRLPPYMCPAVIVAVEALPLNAHGKIDRKFVQQLPCSRIESSTASKLSNMSQTEERLLCLWQKLLPPWGSAIQVDHDTDFFHIGGHSLLLVKLQALIREEFNYAPRLSQLMNDSKLGAMAELLDTNLHNVDWDAEIDVQLGEKFDSPIAKQNVKDGLVIAITGSTGSLGQCIVRELASDPRVSKIMCLVRDINFIFPFESHKIQLIRTELPILPTGDILLQADRILHCAADRNFWDGYNALRPINVDTTKALAHVSIVTGAHLHVLSSGAVAAYENKDNPNLPRPSSKAGYVSTKWVTERYLDCVARQTSVPMISHRPTKTHSSDTQSSLECEAVVARDMISLSKRLGYRPDFTNLSGTIDLAQLGEVAATIAGSVVSRNTPSVDRMTVIEHPGSARVTIQGLATHVEALLQYEENQCVGDLPTKSVLMWVGDAKKTGLFEWFFTAQDIAMEDGEGNRVVTAR